MTHSDVHRDASVESSPRSIPIPLIWAFLPYVIASVFHVTVLALGSPLAGPSKLVLMPLLAVPVVLAWRWMRPEVSILLLVAVIFSWLGDGAGAFFPAGPELPLMLAFFGLAHIAYIVLFARHLVRTRVPWWALAYVAWWVGMVTFLGPSTGSLFFAVAGYGVVLAGTAIFAARCTPLIAVGGAFFLLSDTILAFRLFLPGMPTWTSPAVMLTYTLGQGLIVAGALLALRRSAR